MGRGWKWGDPFTSNLGPRWTGSYHIKEGFQVSKGKWKRSKGESERGSKKQGDCAIIFIIIMYSRKVQKKKYIADTKLQERSQEKHMVVWLQVRKATCLRHWSMLINGYIVGVCKGRLTQTNLMKEEKGTY